MKKLKGILTSVCAFSLLAISALQTGGDLQRVKADELTAVGSVGQREYYSLNAENSFTGATYYEQLDINSKQIYDALKNSALGTNENVKTDFDAKVALGISNTWEDTLFTRETEGGAFAINATTQADISAWFAGVQADVVSALWALIYDEPEISWLVNIGYSLATQGAQVSITVNSMDKLKGTGDYTIEEVFFTIRESDKAEAKSTGGHEDFISALESAKTVLEKDDGKYDVDAVDKNRYQKVEAIHDYVCDTVSYAEGDLSPRKYQTIYSAMMDPAHTTVCAGYAKTFKALCDAYAIPCVLVSGTANNGKRVEDHMWNYVQMPDGEWYGVDTTWADQADINYDYFLKGKDVFDKDHFKDGNMDSVNAFAYPELASGNYVAVNRTPVSTWNVSSVLDGTSDVTAYLYSNEGDATKYDLVFDGVGKMQDWTDELPWQAVKNDILSVKIGKDVEYVGAKAFYACENLQEVSILCATATIGADAFYGCHENLRIKAHVATGAEEHCEHFQSLCIYKYCSDALCSECGAEREPLEHVYIDCDDYDCEECFATRLTVGHADEDKNGKCDVCGGQLETQSSNSSSQSNSSSISASQETATVGGCMGLISGGSVAVVGIFAALLLKKKKQD